MRKYWLCALFLFLAAPVVSAGQVTLHVLAHPHPYIWGVKELLPQFEKETGIKVNLETLGDEQLSQKLAVEFSGGGSSVDVFSTRPMQEGKMFHRNGWYENLNNWIDADYDIKDFKPSCLEATSFGDFQYAIPYSSEVEVLFYRKDMLAEKGIKVPTTFEELEEASKLLTDRDNEMYGFIARGQKNSLISSFSSFAFGFGTTFHDLETNKSLVASPEFIEAIGYYGRLLREYGPPGVLNMAWAQAMSIFVQGKAAIYADGSGTFPNVLDERKSAVADKTGIALFPAGPKARKTYDVVPLALSINPKSPSKEAAWKFIRYFTDKERTLILQGDYANPAARMSIYNLPEGVKKFPADLVQVMNDSVPYTVPSSLPQVIAVTEARDIIGEAVNAAILGQDYAAAAKVADRRYQEILDREAAEVKK